MTTRAAPSERAVGYVRRRTLERAARGYLRWVRETFGWYTVGYLLFWVLLAVISTVQNTVNSSPLGWSADLLPLACPVVVALGLLVQFWSSRTAPVILNRRDLLRLAVTPVPPIEVLRWPFVQAGLLRAAVGLFLGVTWVLIAPGLFGVVVPFALLAVPCLALTGLALSWLGYASRRGENTAARRALLRLGLLIAGALVAGVFSPLGLVDALYEHHVATLFTPVVVCVSAWRGVAASLREGYPPLFAAHCQILSQIRAITTNTRWLQGRPDPDALRRLRAQLHDRQVPTRPRRFLRPPPATWGAGGALLWRSALLLSRRPALDHVVTVVWFAAVVTAGMTVTQQMWGQAVMAASVGALLPRLLGPLPVGALPPVSAPHRTLGRTAPGGVLILGAALVGMLICALVGAWSVVTATALAAAQVVLALTLFEKVTVWADAPSGGADVSIVVGLAVVLLGTFLPAPFAVGVAALLTAVLLRVRWP